MIQRNRNISALYKYGSGTSFFSTNRRTRNAGLSISESCPVMPAYLVFPVGSSPARVQRLNVLLPRIETERLILRPCLLTDWPATRPIWTSPDRAVCIGGPMNDEEAWLDFNECVAGWLLRGTGPLTITLKGSNNNNDTPLGIVLIGVKYKDPQAELGWLFTEAAEGHGYATEAAAALRDWGFGELGRGAFVSYIAADNEASIRVAERLGAWRDPVGHPKDPACAVYRYTR